MQTGYYSASWADIKNSPGWFGKICLLGLVSLIPVFGSMVQYGYAYGWARDIAWDVHRPLPEKIFGNEDGKLYSRGASAWVIFLIASIIGSVVGAFLGDSTFAAMVIVVLTLFLSVFASIGVMRMSIYGRMSAGFQLKKMWSMMSHDFNGLLKIAGMVLLITLIVGVVFGVLISIVIIVFTLIGAFSAGMGVDWNALEYGLAYGGPDAYGQMLNLIAAMAPALGVGMIFIIAILYAAMCAMAWINLIQARAMGYWVRQFDVANWKGQDDPMPFEFADQAMKDAVAAVAMQYMKDANAASENPAANVAADSASQAEHPSNPAASADAGQPVQGGVAAVPVTADPADLAAPAEASASVYEDAADAAAVAVCPACGWSSGDPDVKFCTKCGTRINGDAE